MLLSFSPTALVVPKQAENKLFPISLLCPSYRISCQGSETFDTLSMQYECDRQLATPHSVKAKVLPLLSLCVNRFKFKLKTASHEHSSSSSMTCNKQAKPELVLTQCCQGEHCQLLRRMLLQQILHVLAYARSCNIMQTRLHNKTANCNGFLVIISVPLHPALLCSRFSAIATRHIIHDKFDSRGA